MSKQDKLFKDAMQTAAYSSSDEVAEELLSYFVDIGNKECFAAMLYMCFDLVSPDFVEELSWQHGLNDFFMPFRIQMQRSLVQKVSALEKKVQDLSVKDQKKEQLEADQPIINPGGFGNRLMITQGNGCVLLLRSLDSAAILIIFCRFAPQAPPMMMNGTGMHPVGFRPLPCPNAGSNASLSFQQMTGFPSY